MTATVALPLLPLLNGSLTRRCDGCKHCHWIAPGGQLWRGDARPQMNCLVLGPIAVEATRHGDYLHTYIPIGCPTYVQPSLI